MPTTTTNAKPKAKTATTRERPQGVALLAHGRLVHSFQAHGITLAGGKPQVLSAEQLDIVEREPLHEAHPFGSPHFQPIARIWRSVEAYERERAAAVDHGAEERIADARRQAEEILSQALMPQIATIAGMPPLKGA